MTVKPPLTPFGTNQQVLLGDYNNALNSARYQQEVIAGTNDLVVGVDSLPHGGANWLVNGGLESWNRGTANITSGNTVTPVQAADWWTITNGSVTKGILNESGTGFSAVFGAGTPWGVAAAGTMYQTILEAGELRGRTVTFRFRTSGAVVTGKITDDVGLSVTSITTDCTDHLQRTVVVSGTVGATATKVTCTITVNNNQTAIIDNASLVAYAGPVEYSPHNPALLDICTARSVHTYVFSVRWRATAIGEIYRHFVPWRGAPLPVAPTMSDATLMIGIGTSLNVNTLYVVDVDQYGANVEFTTSVANFDSYFFGCTLVLQLLTTT